MQKITITYDKYDHHYRANLYVKKSITFLRKTFTWWSRQCSISGSMWDARRNAALWQKRFDIDIIEERL